MWTLTTWLPQGPYLENAFAELLASMGKRNVPISAWLAAVHRAACRAGLASGTLRSPGWLERAVFAGRCIENEHSSAVKTNRLCSMLATTRAYEDCNILSPSTMAGPDIVAGVNDGAAGDEARPTGLLLAALKLYGCNLDQELAAFNVLPGNIYQGLGQNALLRQAAKAGAKAFADAGRHFISVVLAIRGHTAAGVTSVTATFGPPGVTFTAAGDVRVVITLPMLVGAFALGEPVTAAAVVRGVLVLAGSCKNLSGYSNEARCMLNEELDAYLSRARAIEAGQFGWMDELDAHVAAVQKRDSKAAPRSKCRRRGGTPHEASSRVRPSPPPAPYAHLGIGQSADDTARSERQIAPPRKRRVARVAGDDSTQGPGPNKRARRCRIS